MRLTVTLATVVGVLVSGLMGWSAGGHIGAAVGALLGLFVLVVRWYRLTLWAWADIYLHRRSKMELAELVTVTNDRFGGGVRYQNGCATVAVQILGKAHAPTFFTGATVTTSENTVDLCDLYAVMRQPLGLTVASMNVISTGARRLHMGDYARVYDTLIGTPPYAGRREMWLVIRFDAFENASALQCRSSVGTAALAAAQRISANLRCRGIRAKVATASDIAELERRLGRDALSPGNRAWQCVRVDSGWLSTYGYRPEDISAETLSQAWALRADGVTLNVTLFPNETLSATITVRTAQPATAPPSVLLRTLPGEQGPAVGRNLCGPAYKLRNLRRGALPATLALPVGPSGTLLGKISAGDRLLLSLSDPGEYSRVHIAAEDAIAKRLIIRAAASGDRITVHSRDAQRWESVRMPNITITDQPKPARGTALSVTDGTVLPTPRPSTVISISKPGVAPRVAPDIGIVQIGPATVSVETSSDTYEVEVEFFRAENRYVANELARVSAAELEFAE